MMRIRNGVTFLHDILSSFSCLLQIFLDHIATFLWISILDNKELKSLTNEFVISGEG